MNGLNTKGFSKKKVLIVVVALALLGAAGWFGLSLKTDSLPTILDKIETGIPNSFNDVAVEKKKWTAQYTTNTPQQVDGYDFKLSPQNNTTITFTRTDSYGEKTVKRFFFFKEKVGTAWALEGQTSPLQEKVNSYFKRNKFTISQDGDTATFKKGNDTCLFSGEQLACYNPELLKSLAEESKQFVDAYVATHPGIKVGNLVFGPVTIKSQDGSGVISSTHEAGYDIAEAVVTVGEVKKVALYYQDTAKKWHFVTDADDEYGFSCDAMKANAEVRKVFYDQVCLGPDGQVKLDTNNRALQ